MGKRQQRGGSLLAWIMATFAALIAGQSDTAWAQSAEAALRGKAPANTEITLRNTTTGYTRHTRSTADGSYSFVGVPPGTYVVDAGPGTNSTVELTVASTATLDLRPAAPEAVPPTTAMATVTISAHSLPEVKTSEVATTISQFQIETVPQITRNFLEFADTVPGMAFNVDSRGSTSLQGGAQNDSSVNVYIDGVGQKSYVKGGGVTGQFSSQGNPFPQLAIGEYKVITSNYKAEYDQISSAAVTAETKSGTNEFRGEVVGTFTEDNFRAQTPAEAAAGQKTQSQDKEYGIAFGGPIIRDVLHYFITYEGKRFDTPITATSGISALTSLLPPSAVSQLGPANLPFTEDLYFGKLDWDMTSSDRLLLSTKVRRESQILDIGVAQAASSGVDAINNDTRVDARWQRSADRWFNELLLTYEDASNSPTARSLGNGLIYTYQPQQDAKILEVGPATAVSTQDKAQRGPALQDDLTLNGLTWLGQHTVKTGIKVKRVTLTAQDAADINPQFYYDVNPGGTAALPYKAFFTDPVPGLSPVATSRNTQLGLYLQDDWAANENWTFNIGVRWDYERTPSYLDHVTPADVVAGLYSQDPNAPPGQTYAETLAKGGVNVSDYISNGHNRSALTDEWQPRLGFSYDLNADQQHVVFGGAGRAYDRDLYDYLQLEETKSALPEYTLFFNVPERPCTLSPTCVTWDPRYLNGLPNLQSLVVASTTGQEVDMLNNHLKAPYSNQFSLGMRNKVGDWNTSIAIARILSYDGFAFTLGNRYPDGSFWKNNSQPWNNGIPGFGSLILGNNGIETRTTQVLLAAEKRYTRASHWGATLAYTYTSAKQNRDILQHYSFDEATIQQYPWILSNAVARHRFVATGTVTGPWGTTVSGKLTLATPIPYDDIACYLAPGSVFPTGSSCTPAAGTPRNTFGYRELDLQVTKDVELKALGTLYVRLDVLNVLNYYNYADYNRDWGANGVPNPNPVSYKTTGNIIGVPRTLKLTMGFRF